MKTLLSKVGQFIKTRKTEFWIVTGLMMLAALAHGINMFHFPYFENDEATYVSQAWSFVHSGKLAPYTFRYDHSPVGWIFLGAWFKLTGGLTTFGSNPILSGRVFIFLLHMCSVLMMYIIAKRVSKQRLAAYIAVIVFSLSPLELYFGRRVLLDNIMIFWLLLSLLFATRAPTKLRSIIFSGVTFAIAALTKENALFFAPAVLYLVWVGAEPRIRKWSASTWLTISLSIMALYPLYAALRGELFAAGSIFGGSNLHVSLIQTTLEQGARGKFTYPWVPSSAFQSNLTEWLHRDPLIIIGGTVSLLAILVLNDRYKMSRAIALTAVAQLIFLARGKLIIDYYILAMLPLLAICMGIFFAKPVEWAKDHISPRGYALTASALLALFFLASGGVAFTRDETTNQQRAIQWVEHNLPKDAIIAGNNYAYPQLHDVDGYKNYDFDFQVQYDPEVLEYKYNFNINKVQYLLISHTDVEQMSSGNLPAIRQLFGKSELIADFRTNTSSFIEMSKLISTNGDWAQVYRVDPKNAGIAVDTWRSYKQNFIKDSGQVVDPTASQTTSEGQSYAMLRAIQMNDKVAFDSTWNWTKQNMARTTDSLFVWRVTIDESGQNHINDTNSATDADEDIARALIEANQKWGSKSYLDSAHSILNSIWDHEVAQRNGRLYLIASADGSNGSELLVNPSYIAPANYRLFASVDKSRNWEKLVDDSYTLLNESQAMSSVGLVSNWVAVEPNGSLASATKLNVTAPDVYGYDAFRVNWRLADDISDSRAKAILTKLTDFLASQYNANKSITSSYDLQGKPLTEYSDVPPSAGAAIGLYAIGNKDLALQIYNSDIFARYNADGSYWGKPYNYYTQNWGAFAVQQLGPGKATPK